MNDAERCPSIKLPDDPTRAPAGATVLRCDRDAGHDGPIHSNDVAWWGLDGTIHWRAP